MTKKPDFTSTSGTSGLTNGTMNSRPSGDLITRTSWPECSTSSTVPTVRAVDRADGQADKVGVAELVRVRRRRDRGGVHRQPGAAQFGRGVPVADALEPDEELA